MPSRPKRRKRPRWKLFLRNRLILVQRLPIIKGYAHHGFSCSCIEAIHNYNIFINFKDLIPGWSMNPSRYDDTDTQKDDSMRSFHSLSLTGARHSSELKRSAVARPRCRRRQIYFFWRLKSTGTIPLPNPEKCALSEEPLELHCPTVICSSP